MTTTNQLNPSIAWDTQAECPWLKQDIPAGRELFVSSDPYGVCGEGGVPVTDGKSEYMFEVPSSAVIGILEV